jgi:maltooligosyltrehalose trehalohydrolase
MSRPGINFLPLGLAEISVWAPFAKTVELVLSKDNTKLPLQAKECGYWGQNSDRIAPGDRYKLLIDGKLLPDIASLSQPEGVRGPSQAIDLGVYQWKDRDWKNPALEQYVTYELHTGTFTPEGTFAGITGKLDYLIELGITAIELLPVAEFPGDRNWGYDGVFPFAVHHAYGGAFELMQLIDTCHQKGVAVIIDVVYNHLGPEGNYFSEFGPYFTDKYHTPWGNAINFDDAWCDAVRAYFMKNSLMWFRDFQVDALRLDAVHAIKDLSAKHILQEIREKVDQLMEETGKVHHLIAELDLNDTRFIDPLSKCGFGMDAQWLDEFHHALRVTAGEERSGYYSDFNGIADLAKSYDDAYVYDGVYSPQRLKTFGNKAINNPGSQFIVFSQNHDHIGNRMLGERSSSLYSFEMLKLLAGAVLVSPFLPLLFMGEEWGAQTPFLYFTSHTDPDLAAAVRNGRRAEFAAFHGKGEVPDPQATETFRKSGLAWHELKNDHQRQLFDYYKAMIALRKQLPALYVTDRKSLKTTVDEPNQILILERWQESQNVCCVMNFSKTVQVVKLPAGDTWHMLLNSADKVWNGPGTAGAGIVNPESLIIYTHSDV